MRAAHAIYDPSVFNIRNVHEAKRIILTPEQERSTEQRWRLETPHLLSLMRGLRLNKESLVLDFGCGIGRNAKSLIEKHGCEVVGADTSFSMLGQAAEYVGSPKFVACHPNMLGRLGPFDAVLSIWVLQHVRDLEVEVAMLRDLMKPRGKLFIVNEGGTGRCIPTNRGWIDDGVDMRTTLKKHFTLKSEGKLAPTVVSAPTSKRTFWAIYEAR